MGREVRMVPPDWEHPRDKSGNYRPLLGHTVGQYDAEAAAWAAGDLSRLPRYVTPGTFDRFGSYARYAGARSPRRRMPDFTPGTATHYMMYETCTEGTPLSPAFATPEELARWLADNGASAFGSATASYEAWLATIHAGSVISAVSFGDGRGLVSGVEAELTAKGPREDEKPEERES